MNMDVVDAISFRDIYKFLQKIEKERHNCKVKVTIKNAVYRGITPNIQFYISGTKINKTPIHSIYVHNFADSGSLIIYLVNAITEYFKQDPIEVNINFIGNLYSTADESYNDFIDHVRRERKERRDRLHEIEMESYKATEFKKGIIDKINDRLLSSKTLNELKSILYEYGIHIGYNNEFLETFQSYKSRIIRIEKLIKSRKNSYIISKLKSGDFKAQDVKKYPELIEAVDELTKLKTVIGIR